MTDTIKEEIFSFPLIKECGLKKDELFDPNNFVFVAIDSKSNKVVGFVVVEPSTQILDPNIQFIEVLSTYQNSGIGRFLIEMCKRYLIKNGKKCVSIQALPSRCSFFRKIGFIDDGLLMKLNLDS